MILQAQLHVFHESMGHSILPRNMVTEHVLYFGRYSAMVFLEAEMSRNVLISPRELDRKGLLLRKAIIARLLEDVTNRRASKVHGYYIAVNQLKANI